jgi:PAS domain S-box-containing protein
MARQMAAILDLSFQQRVTEIEAIAKLPEIISLEEEKLDRILTEMNSVTQFFNYYFIVDPGGKWLSYPSKPYLRGKKVKNDYWIRDTLQNDATTYLDVHLAKIINTLVSGFVTPIRSKNNTVIALIRGVITVSDKNALVEQIKTVKMGQAGFVYIVDSNGQLLAHPKISLTPENAAQYDYKKYLPVANALQGKSGIAEYTYNKQLFIAAYQPVPSTDWALIVQQPKKDIEQQIRNQISEFTKFLIISFLLIAACLTYFFLHSLSTLTRLLKSIRSKQPFKVHMFPQNEIGTLAREFSKYSEQLEEKVAHRTEELQLVNRDLTKEIAERKKAEQRLLEREAAQKSILRATPVGIGLVHDRVFSWVSNQVLQLTGYSEEELIGQSARMVYPSQDEFDKVGRIKYGQLRQRLDVGEVDTVWQRKDGSLVDVHLRSTPVNPADLSEGVTFSVLDITERKKIEENLRRAHKLESLGILAGGIAHDFNNLLQSIIGNISLAKMYVNKEDRVYSKLTETEKAASRATALTLQLLTFSKGGAPIKTTTHIAGIIKNSASFSLQGSNVSCKYFFADDLWLVDVDDGQISQVIQNLVLNANHAMPDGGVITIRAENYRVEPGSLPLLDEGRYIKISIEDQGTGILQEHLPRVFDPYYSTKQTGSGLGLAVAYSIIKNHSGLLTVESVAGHGATFHILLPASDADQTTASTHEEKSIYAGKGRVLVMDDENRVLEVAVEMLGILGYEVTTTRDGRKALQLYTTAMASKPYDFVILDLTVPGGMGGEDTIRKLLELDPDVRALVSSGYANDPIMAEYSRYGFCGVIPKPYTIENLSRALHTLGKPIQRPPQSSST